MDGVAEDLYWPGVDLVTVIDAGVAPVGKDLQARSKMGSFASMEAYSPLSWVYPSGGLAEPICNCVL